MSTRWNEIPFGYRFVNLRKDEPNLSLHFAVGGATQPGTEHLLDNHNNQDALSISIGDNFLLGTVCDGCTSTHDELRDSFSNNEVGAKLFAQTVANNLQKLLKRNRLKHPDSFIKALSQKTSRQLVSLVKTIVGDDEKEREVFIFDFLMSTILGFVVTTENYLVFAYGDGIIALNSQITVLEETGSYFAASILPECCPSLYPKVSNSNTFKLIAHGSTSELQSIFIASDGFREIVQHFDEPLVDFINTGATKPKGGFDFLLLDFRKRILQNTSIEQYSSTLNWPRDDASFLLLRRTDDSKAAETHNESRGEK
jgi:hypothetical protein